MKTTTRETLIDLLSLALLELLTCQPSGAIRLDPDRPPRRRKHRGRHRAFTAAPHDDDRPVQRLLAILRGESHPKPSISGVNHDH